MTRMPKRREESLLGDDDENHPPKRRKNDGDKPKDKEESLLGDDDEDHPPKRRKNDGDTLNDKEAVAARSLQITAGASKALPRVENLVSHDLKKQGIEREPAFKTFVKRIDNLPKNIINQSIPQVAKKSTAVRREWMSLATGTAQLKKTKHAED